MNYQFRIAEGLLAAIHADLSRPHAHAYERVGFIHCRFGAGPHRSVILAQDYASVADADYLESEEMGAVMGPTAIRLALQAVYRHQGPVFHVHRHDHDGIPGFSRVDLRESAKFVPDFWKVAPEMPHGALVLSHDAATGRVWCPRNHEAQPLTSIVSVGTRLTRLGAAHD